MIIKNALGKEKKEEKRVFMVNIETASMLSTVSQAMHSDEEMGTKFGVSVLFW